MKVCARKNVSARGPESTRVLETPSILTKFCQWKGSKTKNRTDLRHFRVHRQATKYLRTPVAARRWDPERRWQRYIALRSVDALRIDRFN